MDGVNSSLTPSQTGQHMAWWLYREQEQEEGLQALGGVFVSWA